MADGTRHVRLPGAGVRLHAARWPGPEHRPPLVVLHGIWESWRTFADCARRWSADRTVYCLDLRGHGDSDRPSTGYRFVDYAADVRVALAAIGPEVDLLGHSLGAAVALHVAAGTTGGGDAGRPARIRRLVAVEPPVLLPGDWPPVRADMARSWRLARRPLDEIVAALPATATRTPGWRRMIAESLAGTADGVFRAMVDAEQGEVAWVGLLRRIATPTLAVAGDPDVAGTLLAGDRMAAFGAGLPSARVAVLPGAGHHVEIDRPACFHALVEEFLSVGAPAPGALSPAPARPTTAALSAARAWPA
ncbi:alpha/beta fold hydrolase [Micromonospora haikouensis]|uniref:alpha/beta fold hydrolase n=1 Tax=Micromonospora haikouensis TaxID=686309 RepID=UPI0009E5E056|nr:alpha/beta fold hydrolase [Micromonospora haikouensis]